jgi:hypothetical protein
MERKKRSKSTFIDRRQIRNGKVRPVVGKEDRWKENTNTNYKNMIFLQTFKKSLHFQSISKCCIG